MHCEYRPHQTFSTLRMLGGEPSARWRYFTEGRAFPKPKLPACEVRVPSLHGLRLRTRILPPALTEYMPLFNNTHLDSSCWHTSGVEATTRALHTVEEAALRPTSGPHLAAQQALIGRPVVCRDS